MEYKKVVMWGHKLHDHHTHAYIHQAFYRAFRHLGYKTHWLDNNDDISKLDLSDALFITEGQVCQKMPIIKGCKYILHNCYDEAMWAKIKAENIKYLKLQTYTDDALQHNAEKIENSIYFKDDMLYMPWATDLLPHEIFYQDVERTNLSWWVGTMGDGVFGNNNELDGFRKACKENNIHFKHANNLSIKENRDRIKESYLAPAIVGTWQKEKGYIPCRIFKNISYGQIGLTNSAATKNIMGEHVIYSPDEYELFFLGKEALAEKDHKDKLIAAMKFVKEHHTYLNRINILLSLL